MRFGPRADDPLHDRSLAMSPIRNHALRLSLAGLLAVAATTPGHARQYGYQGPNYNWGAPYGMNYNYGFMRYGMTGAAGSPYDPMIQAQLNRGMRAAQGDMAGGAAGEMFQGGALNRPDAFAQAIQNQRQNQAMQPRYDVRKKTPRTVQAKDKPASRLLPRNQVLSHEGKVLWPAKAPADGELGKSRAAAEEAIRAAVKETEGGGKASVQSVVEAKERLYAYGRPALEKASGQGRQAATGLLHFLTSLERVLDSLAGV
jgi:hypothetical protein